MKQQKRLTDLSAAERRVLLAQVLRKRADTSRSFPLSYAQERLWFLDQWEPQNAASNIFPIFQLQGSLRVQVLRQSLNEIVRRHQILRTVFLTIENQPAQVILPKTVVGLPVVDLGELSIEEREQQTLSLIEQEAQHPFDLRRGPLLRAMLLRVNIAEHFFLLSIHHIISDGWSMGIFLRELIELYEAFSQGLPSPLPDLPIQYADYALWQRQWLQGEVLQQHLEYWRRQLQGASAILALPTDRSRPSVQTFTGAVYRHILPAELNIALKALSQRERVTFFATLLAAFQVLLSRYSRQEDICVGTYIAGRTQLEVENLIGFFINNLVLRTDLSGDPPFRVLLQRVSKVTQEAYTHQEVPFEKLIQELQPERDPSHTPFFQVMLIYQNMPEYEPSLPTLTIRQLGTERTRANFDLSLWVVEWSEEKLQISFEYNSDLFDAVTIQRLAERFQTLLQAIVVHPEQRISALPLLSTAELHQVLWEWNATEVPFVHDASLDQLFVAQAARTPDTIAVVCEEQHLTYAELERRAGQLAHVLQNQAVGPEVPVGLCLERSLEMIISLCGILKAGGAYVPLDPTYPGERLAFMIEQTRMAMLLTQSTLIKQLPTVDVSLLCLDTDWPVNMTSSSPLIGSPGMAKQLASIIYTSGSTGEPKGVAVEQHSLVNFTQAAARLFDITPGERVLQFASLSFDASAEEIYPCLMRGGTLVLRNETMLSDPARFIQTCRDWGVSVLDLPTAYWHELVVALERGRLVLPGSLRLVIIGGEQAQQERLIDWQRHAGRETALLNTYGPTETTVVASAHEVRSPEEQGAWEAAMIGRALANVQLYVLDQWGLPLPIGIPGELYIGGAGMARGYLHRPELTAERFVPDPFSNRLGARLYRTGDLVRLLPDGSFEYRGRVDRQVKLRGFRIELGEIETVLAQHPGVREAAVLLREDSTGEKRLVAYVVSEPAQSSTSSDLRSFLQQHLPGYMLPASFVQLAAMPQTPNGKLDRRTLPAPETLSREGEHIWELPQTPTEELLADLWRQVLHREQVGRHDHFFESGGHSLLATRLAARVREIFEIELPLRTIFETPTLAGLAHQIEQARRSQQPASIPPLLPQGHYGEAPLSYAQQRLWFLDQLLPDSAAYAVPLALQLTGRLDVITLARCLQELVRRHEALRTTIVARDGLSMQVIAADMQMALFLIDMSALSQQVRELACERLLEQEAQQPFRLDCGPLMRTTLLRLEEERHILLLTLHHIITDAWSMGILLRELAALYQASIQDRPAPFMALPVQYADYAIWQRQWLESPGEHEGEGASSPLEQQLAFWQAQLADAPVRLELPTDHLRPQVQTFRGAHFPFEIEPGLLTELRQLSRQEGATLFMTLLTAFGVLLARYCGQDDLVIGTPIANRTRAEVENVIGFFVNTLALRCDFSGNPSVHAMLRRVREVALGAYDRQDLPFERLVDALRPERDLSHTPLFQVMFALQTATASHLEMTGIQVDLLAVESGLARFDLTLTMREHGDAMQGVLEYNLDLFDPATIERMAMHFQTLLAEMVAHPERTLADLSLLTDAERRQMLVEWNTTSTPLPPNGALVALFEAQAERAADAVALVLGEEQVTYGEVNRRANQLAHYLCELGVTAESYVGVCLERSPALVVGLLGALKAGGAYVPLDPDYPAERLIFMLKDAQATTLITTRAFEQQVFPQHLEDHAALAADRRICLDRERERYMLAHQPTSNGVNRAAPENLAYVIYTSGSTGRPKGVQVTHRGLYNLVSWHQQAFALTRQDRATQVASPSFDAAGWEIWPYLAAGATVIFVTEDARQTPESLRDWLLEQQITRCFLPTPLAESVVEGEWPAGLKLRMLLTGGDWLRRAPKQELPFVFVNNYGPTENTVVATSGTVACTTDQEEPPPIGRPIANVRCYVLDTRLQPVPVGVRGELFLAGTSLARGYLGQPAWTAERFIPDPFSTTGGERLYRTGDLVRYLPDGQLEYCGRNDYQVKIRGYRIELGEIEMTLCQHPQLRAALVATWEPRRGDRRLVAYVVAASDQIPSPSDLRSFLSERLPAYLLPAVFVPLEAFPLTPNGKLDRRALPAPEVVLAEGEENADMPRTATERMLAGIWADVLRLERVGMHENYFELGGDSLLSMQIVAKAIAAGLPLTPKNLFQYQTIAQLAAIISINAPLLQTDQEAVQGEMPLMPIQHWFFEQALPEPEHWNQAILLQTQKPVSPSLVSEALDALLLHHDALRLRAQCSPGDWQLCYADSETHVLLTQIDLSNVSEAEQRVALVAAASSLQASLNLMDGPILRAALFDLGAEQPARLLLVIHHLAIDIVSWSILLEDLQTSYEQLQQGQFVRLPAKTTSFQQWAHRLQAQAQTVAARSQLAYWLGQAWEQVRPLPVDQPAGPHANREDAARSLVVALSVEQTQALLSEVPRAYHTQINDVLLTALVQAFSHWTGQPCLLLHLEGHGREDLFDGVDLSRTVGWFTSLIPLVLEIKEGEGPAERLKRIKEQLRTMPQGGIGFGLLRYLCQDAALREQLAALPQPEVSFNYGGRTGSALSPEGLFVPATESAGAVHSLKGRRPHVLEINGGILEGQLYLQWNYSERLHWHTTIEKLAQSYLEALQELIEHCQSPQAGGYTPSDFPEARLSQTVLDTLMTMLRKTGHDAFPARPHVEAIYPLSPLQEGMLFHSLYALQSGVYFEQVNYTLRGTLDGAAFRAAWQQVIEHHPILRTLFVWEQVERPLQVVQPQVVLPYQEHDWRHLSVEEQAEALQRWLQADRACGFELGDAPLLRLSVIHLAEEQVHVIWSFHHLLLDGWSVGTVLSEVFACYEARSQGRQLTLPTRRPYRDYIGWLQQQELEQAEHFWRERLRGFSAPTPLGIDRPGHTPHGASDDYHDYAFLLPAAATAGLQRLARQQQVTLNTLMQGAWALLLARYSGQDDIVFGTTVSGRPATLAGVEAMVGLFINTLPVRVQISREQRLVSWLQHMLVQQAEARQYEYSPLAQVQGWSEVPRGQPLFESLLVFENYPIDASTTQARERRLTIESVEAVEQTNYPLTITVVPGTCIAIRLGYMGSRFEAAAIERLAGHLQTLLENMLAQPEQCLSQVSLFTKAELQQIVYDWNMTQTNYPHNQSIAQVFEAQARRVPEAIALVCEEKLLTYQELDERANQLARYLEQLGVGCETLVGLCLERSIELVIAILAILKAGGAYVPLDLSYPQERLAFMLQDAQIPVLLTQKHLQVRSPMTGVHVICLEEAWPAIAQQSRNVLHCADRSQYLAYVIYTSGSTGAPKGVQVQQGSVLRLVCGANYVPLDEHIRVLHLAPISFDAATFELWAPLLHGGRCILFAGELPSVQEVGQVLRREAITMLWLTASLFNVVIDEAPEALAELEYLLIGGEALSMPHVRRGLEMLPGVQIINGYGPTENTTFSCCEPIEPSLPAEARSIPIGRPIANTQTYVLDVARQPAPIGVVGELYLGGAGLARGYLSRPELTAERFVPHPFSVEPGARLYRTGDLVRYLPDGRLEFAGRRDGQVKLRGFRIELGEIEATLQQHSSVREAVVVVQEPQQGEKLLVAYVVPSPGQALSLSALRAFLSTRLPTYMLPAAFVPLEELPLTANGKLDRRSLPNLDGARLEPHKEYVAPHTEIEQTLAQIWSQVLGIQQIGVQDDFFELGGHSLLATQIVSRVRASFQIELPLRSLFLAPTIADYAQVIATHQSEQGTLSLSATEIQDEQDDETQLLMHLDRLSSEEMEALFDIMVTEKEIDG